MLSASTEAIQSNSSPAINAGPAFIPQCKIKDWVKFFYHLPQERLAASRDHGLGNLTLTHHHQVRAVLLQVFDFLVGVSPRDDRQIGPKASRLGHYLAAFEGVGNGDQQAARSRKIGGLDHLGIGGIASDDLLPYLTQPACDVDIVLDYQTGRVGLRAVAP